MLKALPSRPPALPAIGTGEASAEGSALVPVEPLPVPATGSTPGGAGLDGHLLETEADDPTDDLAAYNRYLALLAVRGTAKTWRNPRGIQE